MQLNFFDFLVRGIDVSKYDLKLIVENLIGKVHFVIARIGHGTKTDPLFKEFWNALRGKIFRLAYFYLDYYSNHLEGEAVFGIGDYEWGVIQGQNAWNNQKDDNDKGLVYVDVENGDPAYAPEIDTVWSRVETMMDGFYDTYDKASGLVNGIYASLSKFKNFSPRFRHRPAYVALYDEDDDGKERTRESVIAEMRAVGWTGEIHFWQYASNGDTGTDSVGDGLEFGLGRKVMDLDVWMGTVDEWKEFTGESKVGDIRLNIGSISQRDRRWYDVPLGISNSTIGWYGCLITDATMMINFLLGRNITPADLNTWLIANGGYYEGNLFVWDVLKKYDSRITFGYRYKGAYLDKIDEQLAKGMPVIVNVDMNPATSALEEHWVLVIGKEQGQYIINDPWYGLTMPFNKNYGDPRTGVKIVSTYNFSGEIAPLPPVTPPEPLYRVRVKAGITALVIRSAPSESASVVHRYAAGEYDVFEEVRDKKDHQYLFGRIGVGRWIALDYTERIGAVDPEPAPDLTLEERVAALEARVLILENKSQ